MEVTPSYQLLRHLEVQVRDLHVELGERSSSLLLSSQVSRSAGPWRIRQAPAPVLVTDERVGALYADEVREALSVRATGCIW